jgi:hypothetical protein
MSEAALSSRYGWRIVPQFISIPSLPIPSAFMSVTRSRTSKESKSTCNDCTARPSVSGRAQPTRDQPDDQAPSLRVSARHIDRPGNKVDVFPLGLL